MSKIKVIRKNENGVETKEKKEKNKIKKEVNNNSSNNFILNKTSKYLLITQFIFTLLSVILAIMSLINNKFTEYFQLLFGIDMIIIGINYKKVYNKPKFVLLYLICGIIFIGLAIMGWFF